MRYTDTIERSAEFLRLAIPHMSRQDTALHPVSYAVWYEYVSGRNEALRARVDELVADGGKLDEQETLALFARHIAEMDPSVAQRVSDGFQRIISGMAESAAQAGDQTARFDSSLSSFSAALNQAGGQPTDAEVIDKVLRSTREMRSAVDHLQQRLVDSQTEIQRLKQEVERARSDALIDSLTGLANRRAFDECLESCVQEGRPRQRGLCLVMLDIDHFKRVNDTYGHLLGDQVIRAVAQVLKASVKGQDTAARVGGEEFAVLLPDTPVNGATVVAEKIRAAIAAARIRRGQQDLAERITVSLGVACHRLGETARELMDRADAALYVSKTGGRNCVTLAPLGD